MIILKRPILTEKSLKQYKDKNIVTFEVSLDATKDTARKVLEKVYSVTVSSVTVISRLGKKKVSPLTRKTVRKSQDKKIMLFKLKKGDKIDLFNE